jgi:hypothetical protein
MPDGNAEGVRGRLVFGQCADVLVIIARLPAAPVCGKSASREYINAKGIGPVP